MLQIEHLTKSYKPAQQGFLKNLARKFTKQTVKDAAESSHALETFAVRDLSLNVESGDIFAFIGPNGAGKTTTIKSIVGIHSFDSGTITIDGHSIVDEPLAAKQIFSYLPDNPEIYNYVSGIQYLRFVADMYGVDPRLARERMHKYADLFELTSKLNMRCADYSHGMKQKIAIIASLLHNPRLLVLDEPFVGLDPEATLHFKEIMHEICQAGGAVFYSTHVLEVAEKLCNKAAMIKNGRLVAQGTMSELTHNTSLETLFMNELADDSASLVTGESSGLVTGEATVSTRENANTDEPCDLSDTATSNTSAE